VMSDPLRGPIAAARRTSTYAADERPERNRTERDQTGGARAGSLSRAVARCHTSAVASTVSAAVRLTVTGPQSDSADLHDRIEWQIAQ